MAVEKERAVESSAGEPTILQLRVVYIARISGRGTAGAPTETGSIVEIVEAAV